MYWQKLAGRGMFVPTGKITACWTSHPHQRHKLVSERYGGGINKLRNHYKTKTPLRIRLSKEKTWDEAKVYSSYRSECALAEKPLKILIVGELAYIPEDKTHADNDIMGVSVFDLPEDSPVMQGTREALRKMQLI